MCAKCDVSQQTNFNSTKKESRVNFAVARLQNKASAQRRIQYRPYVTTVTSLLLDPQIKCHSVLKLMNIIDRINKISAVSKESLHIGLKKKDLRKKITQTRFLVTLGGFDCNVQALSHVYIV